MFPFGVSVEQRLDKKRLLQVYEFIAPILQPGMHLGVTSANLSI